MQKRVVDLALAFVCLAIAGIAWLYPAQVGYEEILKWAGGGGGLFFLLLAAVERPRRQTEGGRQNEALPSDGLVTELVLLSEEDTELQVWDLYGKTAAVIGRDVKENQVDIDLGGSPYASMVDIEHAVLNFSAGNWYVEDLGSANGISVKKAVDKRVYKLSAGTPCRLERGDCLYVGLNRLLLR